MDPCLTPPSTGNGSEIVPLKLIPACMSSCKDFVRDTNLSVQPNFFNTLDSIYLLTVSNALSSREYHVTRTSLCLKTIFCFT